MGSLQMTVENRRNLTADIAEFTLRGADDGALPPFDPGAHVTVKTPSGAMRRYSLVNDGTAPDRYVIAVKREPQSRGGSASMHDSAAPGSRLTVSRPENDFPLADAPEYLLIAGGIGITPIQSMARQLDAQEKPFRLIYCTRSADRAAYLDDLRRAYGDRLLVHHDDGDPEAAFDFWEEFETPGRGHVYCCGPKPLMEEIEAISGHWPETAIHFEDFKPVEVVRADDTAFEVELKRSAEVLTVPADQSILETLRANGKQTVSSCESGTCGTCKTRLLAGNPDHRDMVLTDEERDSRIMICVSRATSGRLILDL